MHGHGRMVCAPGVRCPERVVDEIRADYMFNVYLHVEGVTCDPSHSVSPIRCEHM
jgi:hypothetical protein